MDSAIKNLKFEDFSPSRSADGNGNSLPCFQARKDLLNEAFKTYKYFLASPENGQVEDRCFVLVASKTNEDRFGEEVYCLCYINHSIFSPTTLEKVYFVTPYRKCQSGMVFEMQPFALKARVEARYIRGRFLNWKLLENGRKVKLEDFKKLPLGLFC